MEGEGLKNEIWLLIRNILEELEDVLTPIVSSHGLTLAQARLLMACARQPDLTIGQISQQTGIAAANVSAMCKRLEGAGFLLRSRDHADERVVHIRLTAEGAHTFQAVNDALEQRYACLFSREDPLEMQRMLDGLRKLNRLLQGSKDTALQQESKN
ncbi:MAG: MarR family transcriptional regulator [Provencibacterium sp.]|nr:MarR family transcriptional regulator [Provencibacterium sp.]